ncbi:RNA polymerase sigma factor [Actinokineospora cianjurensis]|uniref:RNA polymerase sigma factor (Sigma-70 family) n=1 Tax=Actinokineospora cianjurensis TaxID=585224 RepID=A0A421AUI2_9PSEU|nr:sigma-70 family RNA polymerase sigma factor [Actinokineospora cianjurensis]RLK53749.1 RNA polymerase sigma factor (sigma-70 family) [Actinokineospora cianjurensis]
MRADLVRALVPQVLGAVVRRYGHFDAAEDAVQEALIAAHRQWPVEGTPADPKAWLVRVAARRLVDGLRAEQARRRREEVVATRSVRDDDGVVVPDSDDTLALLFLCCHPALTQDAQVPLTLRAVAGLTTAEIARAYLVPEATMAKRITRAKRRVLDSGTGFAEPGSLAAVLQVLYLVFTEGHTGRADLAAEAIRLTEHVRRLRQNDAEVAGLLALMLLTDARAATRITPEGALVPLAEQNRALWDRARITQGTELVEFALTRGKEFGPYTVQAAIAAVHAEAPSAEDTDWAQILALYHLLERVTDNPVVTLNRAVATAMVHGPRAGLTVVDSVAGHLSTNHRLAAVRAHLWELAGEPTAAREHYLAAARQTTSTPEREHLLSRAARLA